MIASSTGKAKKTEIASPAGIANNSEIYFQQHWLLFTVLAILVFSGLLVVLAMLGGLAISAVPATSLFKLINAILRIDRIC